LEAAVQPIAAGSIDPGTYEVNYLAQARWHGFRYCFGEMIGLDRTRKALHLAATFDDEGRQITHAAGAGRASASLAHGTPDRAPNARQLFPYTYHDSAHWFRWGMEYRGKPDGILVRSWLPQIMYRSLRVMHDQAVGGTTRALLGIFIRALADRAGPRVSLSTIPG
jgi:hypothetical protein